MLAALWLAGAGWAQEARTADPIVLDVHGLTLRPGGFLDMIGMTRSASTTDSVSTHFGSIPLESTPEQSLASPRHSRLQLKSDYTWEGLKLSGYLESDFLNCTPAQSDFRWRQYWGRIQFGKWEILGGQAWSLLRPNRTGFASDRDLMNTDVADPAYHVGLVGSRLRQFRLGRTFGDYKAVVAWETQGNFLAKVTADKRFGHLEVAAFTGHRGRRGATVSGVLNLTSRLKFVTQEYWSKRAAYQALGVVPAGPNGMATIQGLEFHPARHVEVYSYGGVVYAAHNTGNRLVREWTVGMDRRTESHALRGAVLLSLQLSRTDRFAWTGQSGEMNFVMYRVRYTFN